MKITTSRYGNSLLITAVLENPTTLAVLTATSISATVYSVSSTGALTAISGMAAVAMPALDAGAGAYGVALPVPAGTSVGSIVVIVRAVAGSVDMVGLYAGQSAVGGPAIVVTPKGVIS